MSVTTSLGIGKYIRKALGSSAKAVGKATGKAIVGTGRAIGSAIEDTVNIAGPALGTVFDVVNPLYKAQARAGGAALDALTRPITKPVGKAAKAYGKRMVVKTDPKLSNLMTGYKMSALGNTTFAAAGLGIGIGGAAIQYQGYTNYGYGKAFEQKTLGSPYKMAVAPPPSVGYAPRVSGSKYKMGATGDLVLAMNANR
jgi:hypothetical protein